MTDGPPGFITPGGGIHGPINPPDGYPTEGSGGGWIETEHGGNLKPLGMKPIGI